MKDEKFINFRVALTKSQMSVSDVAGEMGITPQALYSKLNGRTKFTLSDMQKAKGIFSKRLGKISLEYLFGDDNDN